MHYKLTEIVDKFGLPKSTISRYKKALSEEKEKLWIRTSLSPDTNRKITLYHHDFVKSILDKKGGKNGPSLPDDKANVESKKQAKKSASKDRSYEENNYLLIKMLKGELEVKNKVIENLQQQHKESTEQLRLLLGRAQAEN